MSTYTDLHNRVKENITVDYNNRITPQRVRFFNELNEFWGTLRGHVSAENINIEGGSLSGVTLTDTILKGSVALPDGIDLHKVLQQVKQISVDLILTTENLDQEIDDRKVAVEEEKDNRISADNYEMFLRSLKDQGLSDAVDQTNKDLKREISTLNIVLTKQDYDISTLLSTELSAERIARVTVDNYLSDAIVESRADFGREVFDRKVADEKLELSIAAEVVRSIRRDNELSAALSAHIEDNIESFTNLSLDMLNTVEHERHYVINKGDNVSKLTDSWPYECKDFAVNIYNPSLNDGAVYYKDSSENEYAVGTIHKLNIDELYPFNFNTYKNIQHEGIASVLFANHRYTFNENEKNFSTGMNGYMIKFDDEKHPQTLSNFTFSLYPTLPQYHEMTYLGFMEGKVTEAYPENYTTNIISGKMWFDTTDTLLETFNKFRNRIFNNTDLSVHNLQTERVTYLGDNKFKCEKNIDRATYIGLYDIIHSEHFEFGRIYDRYDGISGIISDDAGIEGINIVLATPYNKMAQLNRENFFKNTISSDVKIDDVSYDYIVSADVDGISATFDFVKVSELYKYEFNGIDSEGKPFVGGYVVPKSYNKTIKETIDFAEVSADIKDIMWIDAFKNTYTLTKAPSDILWTVEDRDEDGNVLNVTFNGQTLYVKVTSGSNGEIVRSELDVDIDNPTVYNTDNCHDHLYTTALTDLSKYKEVHESPAATYIVTIENEVRSDELPRYELNINTANTGLMKIQVPERTSDDISREFMIVINPDCGVDKLVQLMFVDKDGKEVKITNNRHKKLLVPTNKWTTIQLKEIDDNVFFLKDLDDNEDTHDIEFLSNAIDVEVSNRISNDTYISTELNLSVDSLQEQILSNDADIADIYAKIKGGINYKGIIYGQLRDSSLAIVDIPTISNLFVWNKHHYSINDYTEDTILSNGFMYIMKTLEGSEKTKFIIEGVDIEVRDCLIINCRSTDPTCNGKAIKDLTSADVDIIDAEDSDVIHRPELSGISAFLSAEISANDADIKYLSNELSTIEWILLSGFNFLSDNIDYVSCEVSCNDNDIKYLSDNVEFLLSVDRETMNYKGTLPYLPNLSNDITHEDLGYNYLSTFILQNMGIHASMRLKLGDFFRLSAVQSCLYDANHTACWFGSKDYFVFNKDCIVSDVVETDFDTFRNAETEFGWLSAALCAEIDNLRTSLSDTVELSVKNLQNLIISNDNDISFLSGQHDWLSDELSTNINKLSTSLSDTTRISVLNLQDQIISNDNDITYVSAQVDFLLSAGQDSMEYKGTIPHYNPTGTLTSNYHLSAFLKPMVKDPDGFIKKGFMYRLSAIQDTLSDDTGYTTYLGAKDYFVMNKDVTLDTIKFADLDIFRNAESEFEWLSTALCSEISSLSTSLSDTTRLSIENLQDQIIANDNDIEFLSSEAKRLSTELSNNIDKLSTDLSTDITNLNISLSDTVELSVKNLQDQVISNDNDIEYLSHNISCEVERNKNHVAYFNDVILSTKYLDSDKISEAHNQLYGLLLTNLSIDFNKDAKVNKGFLFRAKGNDLSIYKNTDEYVNYELHDNDFILINKDINTLIDIRLSDVEIIKDYDLSVLNLQNLIISNDNDISFLSGQHDWLSDEVSANIEALSDSLSDVITISVTNLQNQIIANDNDIAFISAEVSCNDSDISFLSGQHDWLSDEVSANIEALSDSLSDVITISVTNLQNQIIANDNDIKFLSTDLSTLEYDHYNKTLSNDISVDHTYEDVEHHIVKITKVVDQLIILDEVTFDRYRLTIRNGSLNINKIDNVVPTI